MCVQVGESNRPSFRPGLEGGSSDDEASSGRGGPSQSGIEHRRSAEGQVINPPVTGKILSFTTTPFFLVFCLVILLSLCIKWRAAFRERFVSVIGIPSVMA